MKTHLSPMCPTTKRDNTLYRKVGRRYVAVSDPWACDGLREGHWQVVVRSNSTSVRQVVWPNKPAVEAALHDLEDRLVSIIREATAVRPAKQKLSAEEKRAWEHLIKVGGSKWSTLNYNSIQGIADEIVGRVREKVKDREAERVAKLDQYHCRECEMPRYNCLCSHDD